MTVGNAIANVALAEHIGAGGKTYWAWGEAHGMAHSLSGKAWCDLFASYCVFEGTAGKRVVCEGMKAGRGEVFAGGCTYVPTTEKWARRGGYFIESAEFPMAGDLVLSAIHGATHGTHIGVVASVDYSDDSWKALCIEGNYGNKLAKVHRGPNDKADGHGRVVGFIRFREAEVAAAPESIGADAPDSDSYEGDVRALVGDDMTTPVRCRICGTNEDGSAMLQVVADDGSVSMDAPVLQSGGDYLLLGAWCE